MSHPVLAGQVGGRPRIVGQFQHLHIPRQAVHLLHPRNHQVEAGGMHLFLNPAVHPQTHDLDAEFVGLHIDEQQVVGKHHDGSGDHQVLEFAAAGNPDPGDGNPLLF